MRCSTEKNKCDIHAERCINVFFNVNSKLPFLTNPSLQKLYLATSWKPQTMQLLMICM